MGNQPWSTGEWHNPPSAVAEDGPDLLVTATKGSDAWRTTAHGYITDSAHALLAPLPTDSAVEVTFVADLTQQFDQAGIMLRASPTHWIKAGAEFADGAFQLGCVVTRDTSDWSSTPEPIWAGQTITLSATRTADAVIIRARRMDDPFRTIRVAWVDPALTYTAGPYLAAPTRTGLTVRFTSWSVTPADGTVHPNGLPEF